jgi:hypothetical protein
LKKFVLFSVLVLALALTFPGYAFAEEAPAYEIGTYKATADTIVYVDKAGTSYALFAIPATYYFNVNDTFDADRCYINYNGSSDADDFYVLKSDTTFSAVVDNEKYPQNGFKINLLVKNDLTSFSFFAKDSRNRFTETTRNKTDTMTIAFFGKSTYNDTAVAFVKLTDTANAAADGYGYIAVSDLTTSSGTAFAEYDIPWHDNSKPVTEGDVESAPSKEVPEDREWIKTF